MIFNSRLNPRGLTWMTISSQRIKHGLGLLVLSMAIVVGVADAHASQVTAIVQDGQDDVGPTTLCLTNLNYMMTLNLKGGTQIKTVKWKILAKNPDGTCPKYEEYLRDTTVGNPIPLNVSFAALGTVKIDADVTYSEGAGTPPEPSNTVTVTFTIEPPDDFEIGGNDPNHEYTYGEPDGKAIITFGLKYKSNPCMGFNVLPKERIRDIEPVEQEVFGGWVGDYPLFVMDEPLGVIKDIKAFANNANPGPGDPGTTFWKYEQKIGLKCSTWCDNVPRFIELGTVLVEFKRGTNGGWRLNVTRL